MGGRREGEVRHPTLAQQLPLGAIPKHGRTVHQEQCRSVLISERTQVATELETRLYSHRVHRASPTSHQRPDLAYRCHFQRVG